MPLTPAEKQRRFRERQAAKMARMLESITEARAALDGNTKPLALKVIAILDRGLA